MSTNNDFIQNSPKWKESKCISLSEWYIHLMEYDSTV